MAHRRLPHPAGGRPARPQHPRLRSGPGRHCAACCRKLDVVDHDPADAARPAELTYPNIEQAAEVCAGEAVQFLNEGSEFAAVTPGAPAGGADKNKGPGPAIRRRQTPAGDLDTMTVRSRSISRSTRAFGSICMRERALQKGEGFAQIDILHGTYARACRDVRRRWPFGNGPRQVALQWSGERAHLGKPGNSLLIALVAVVVVPLAGIGFIIYLGIKHRSGVLILLGALDGIILIQAALVPPARSASLSGRWAHSARPPSSVVMGSAAVRPGPSGCRAGRPVRVC